MVMTWVSEPVSEAPLSPPDTPRQGNTTEVENSDSAIGLEQATAPPSPMSHSGRPSSNRRGSSNSQSRRQQAQQQQQQQRQQQIQQQQQQQQPQLPYSPIAGPSYSVHHPEAGVHYPQQQAYMNTYTMNHAHSQPQSMPPPPPQSFSSFQHYPSSHPPAPSFPPAMFHPSSSPPYMSPGSTPAPSNQAPPFNSGAPFQYAPSVPAGNPYVSFPSQSFSQSPLYQPQYPQQSSYPASSYAPSQEDAQGMWWYLPPTMSALQHQTGSSTSSSYQQQQFVYPSLDGGVHYPLRSPVSAPRSPVPAPLLNHQHLTTSTPSSPLPPNTTTNSSSPFLDGEKEDSPPVRKPYHPNPPAQRSEWVMWVGNVPSDATHDELWRFFSTTQSPMNVDGEEGSGVVSIFLISRSSCAFVNYDSEQRLQSAIEKFNGVQLRPSDTRCPRMVCRVRRRGDDLKAGVGGQRGMGMHTRYVKDKGKTDDVPLPTRSEDSLSSASEDVNSSISSIPSVPSLPDGDLGLDGLSIRGAKGGVDGRKAPAPKHSNSPGAASFASTNSSFLARNFPERFFILKSLSQFDLDLSVEKGLWATQKHNEGVLDQAYRTSKEVYLIFGVNKSGEFYGYAKMAGPLRHGEQRVPWEKRTGSTTSSSRSSIQLSPVAGRSSIQKDIIDEKTQVKTRDYFPSRKVEASPLPMTASDAALTGDRDITPSSNPPETHVPATTDGSNPGSSEFIPGTRTYSPAPWTAPAELHQIHRKLTLPSDILLAAQRNATDLSGLPDPSARKPQSMNIPNAEPPRKDITLNKAAPLIAIKNSTDDTMEQKVNEAKDGAKLTDKDEDSWGEPFRIEWIVTQRLPFYKTRHLRNPWNHDREVKVSRDGTELEPKVGQQLLDEWVSLAEAARTEDPPPSRKHQETHSTTDHALPRSVSGS